MHEGEPGGEIRTPKTRFKRGEETPPEPEVVQRRQSLTPPEKSRVAAATPSADDVLESRRKSLRKVGLSLKDASPV